MENTCQNTSIDILEEENNQILPTLEDNSSVKKLATNFVNCINNEVNTPIIIFFICSVFFQTPVLEYFNTYIPFILNKNVPYSQTTAIGVVSMSFLITIIYLFVKQLVLLL